MTPGLMLYWHHFPASSSYAGPWCYHISPSSNLLMVGSTVMGMSLEGREREREMIPEARCCSQDHREQGAREDGVGLAHLSGTTQRNSLGLPLCRISSQLPRFPKSGCWGTSITASYSFGEGGYKLFALRQVTLSNQVNRLSPSL